MIYGKHYEAGCKPVPAKFYRGSGFITEVDFYAGASLQPGSYVLCESGFAIWSLCF
ncbi:MAG: hypothetical protein KAS01_00010 [Candidatus Pacebacteria bacterium]|nr:hypothetical protein [Candidatus Paceibacterota bacterium]